jgi:ABC-type glutathione transport system ATPase component
VLSVRGLSTKRLLRDVSFDVHAGEILGFAGCMGAGRTEVARAIVGADRREAGVVSVRGREVDIQNPRMPRASASATSPRTASSSASSSSAACARTSCSPRSATTSARSASCGAAASRRRAREYVRKLRIKTPSTAQLVRNLSGGNQQKVVIAKWLAKDCDVLNLRRGRRRASTSGAKEEIYVLLRELAEQGKAIVMISSELPEVLRLADRIAVMAEGDSPPCSTTPTPTQENVMDYATRFSAEGPSHEPHHHPDDRDALDIGLCRGRGRARPGSPGCAARCSKLLAGREPHRHRRVLLVRELPLLHREQPHLDPDRGDRDRHPRPRHDVRHHHGRHRPVDRHGHGALRRHGRRVPHVLGLAALGGRDRHDPVRRAHRTGQRL